MTLLGLIGDTQGRYRLEDLMARVLPHFEGVDEVWHAGDWQDYRVLDALRELGKPLVVVNGNAPDDRAYPERVERRVEELLVGMVHRPPRPEDEWTRRLDVCIHGHTHRWRDQVVGHTRFVNVSTPTAAGFSQERTIGRLLIVGRDATLERIPV